MRAARGLALAALGGFAALALASGLDRMSERQPELARHVPGPFQVNAARSLALRAILAGDGDAAAGPARRAVAGDPIDARALGLLGQAYLLSNRPVQAEQWFARAGKLGWREPFTQIYWMTHALQRADFAGASVRLDAILRQQPQFPGRAQLLAPFERDDAGREAIAVRLAAEPAWARDYFADAWNESPATRAARADVARRLALVHGVRNCAMVMPVVQGEVRDTAFARAYATWQPHCAPGGAAQLPYDGEFERTALDGPRASFEWTFSGDGALLVAIGPAGGMNGNALSVSNSAPGERSFASQLLPLRPGRYLVSWRASRGAGGIGVGLDCNGSPRRPRAGEPVSGAPGRYRAVFDLPARCAGAWLTLGAPAGASDLTIDEIAVRPG